MKKLVLIILTLTLITACNNEPLDPNLVDPNSGNPGDENGDGDGDGGSNSGDLTLSIYEIDTQINVSLFGIPIETITNSDLNISDNKIVSGINALSANNSSFEIENQTITRNSSGQITRDASVNSEGVTTNETIITYTNGLISQISYNDYIDDGLEDYIYNITYSGSAVIRNEVGSTVSTIFTRDASNRIIGKESYDQGFFIQNETLAYNDLGNINSSVTTGEIQSNSTYQFDDNTNPLKVIFEDNYLLNFLTDDYEDEIGAQVAQFLSTNNWDGATFNGETFTFNIEYNTEDRISSRYIAYDFGPELMFAISETFNYIN